MFDSDAPEPGRRKRRVREQTPVQRALGLLVRREHSRKELTRKLTARGIETEAATAAVEKLTEAGWQDDTRFAENLVRMRANTGYGPLHIRAELGTHGLDSEQIAAAMDTFEGDWTVNARDLVRRRFGEAGPQELAQRRKAADLLARRGFDGDSIRRATRFDLED
ncbi:MULTISPECIES: recombination regulator RecX [Stenotrophomonas]|uniref:recombination regulator RecX n=1 Tax=Stenotrophomonas TaxID=40323 RepID=UPI000871C725|nr:MULTISPECIES: recombination regulator RecX [Stenotrophomonas]OEZ01506.1 recombination regulator RecX [Stenotrophomonas sp. BIIR7]